MEIEKLYELRNIASSLKNGIDPTSNIYFSDDTVMNHPIIKKYNCDICELLDSLILSYKCKKGRKPRKIPFFMVKEDINAFPYSNTPISISEICYRMNEHIPDGMSRIRATQLARGLVKLGYLIEKNVDENKSIKIPTEQGNQLGIVGVKKTNSYGNEYYTNLYNESAQYYVVNNYNAILMACEVVN